MANIVRFADSRFRQTELIRIDGVRTFGLWEDFIKDLPFDLFTVPNNLAGRADEVSEVVYGTPKLFWAIIAYNNVRDPLNWPPAGITIKVPVVSSLLSEL